MESPERTDPESWYTNDPADAPAPRTLPALAPELAVDQSSALENAELENSPIESSEIDTTAVEADDVATVDWSEVSAPAVLTGEADALDAYDVTALADEAYEPPPKGFLPFAAAVLIGTVALGALAVLMVSSVQGGSTATVGAPVLASADDSAEGDDGIADSVAVVGTEDSGETEDASLPSDGTSSDETPSPAVPTAGPWAGTARIQMIGDSITEAPQTRAALVDQLTERGCPFDMVGTRNRFADEVGDADHDGYEGFSTPQLLELSPDIVQAANPSIVLLHAGTNDLGGGIAPAEAADRMEEMVRTIQVSRPGVTVFVAEIIPLGGATVEVEAFNALLATRLPALSDRRSPVVMVDHFTGFDLAVHSDDDVHPNDAGGARLGAAWADALEGTLGPCS